MYVHTYITITARISKCRYITFDIVRRRALVNEIIKINMLIIIANFYKFAYLNGNTFLVLILKICYSSSKFGTYNICMCDATS